MADIPDYKQTRIEHASPDVLLQMLDQAQKQLEIHNRAANNTRQAKDKRDRAAIKAEQCKAFIRQIQAEAQQRIALETAKRNQAKAEHLAIASRPYEPEQEELNERQQISAYQQLIGLEDNLTRAKLKEIEFEQRAAKAATETDRIKNTELAGYWKKRGENAESRINEWIGMHKDDAYKPWLGDDQPEPRNVH